MLGSLLATPARLAFGAGVVAVSVAGVAGLASSALFTDSADSSANTFVSGTVSIDPSGGTDFPVAIGAMKIGSSEQREIIVANDGTLGLTYTITSAASGTSSATLGAALNAKLQAGACAANTSTPLYNAALTGLAYATPSAVVAAAGSQTLCLTVSLPTTGTDAGDNALQGLSADRTLTFTATQA